MCFKLEWKCKYVGLIRKHIRRTITVWRRDEPVLKAQHVQAKTWALLAETFTRSNELHSGQNFLCASCDLSGSINSEAADILILLMTMRIRISKVFVGWVRKHASSNDRHCEEVFFLARLKLLQNSIKPQRKSKMFRNSYDTDVTTWSPGVWIGFSQCHPSSSTKCNKTWLQSSSA